MAAKRLTRVIQITDCHLPQEAGEWQRGCNADANLAAVLAEVRKWQPDALIASGDLTDAGDPGAYARLRAHLEPLGIPVFAIPGNHDEPRQMRRWLCRGAIRWVDQVRLDGWRLLLLDSTIPGQPGGRLDSAALAGVARRAAAGPNLVFVHHHPVPVDSPWIDAMGLANGEELLAVLARAATTRAVACGHVHHVFATRRAGIEVLTAPATSFQAEPRRPVFSRDTLGPGFRWFDLDPHGAWRSGTWRVSPPRDGD